MKKYFLIIVLLLIAMHTTQVSATNTSSKFIDGLKWEMVSIATFGLLLGMQKLRKLEIKQKNVFNVSVFTPLGGAIAYSVCSTIPFAPYGKWGVGIVLIALTSIGAQYLFKSDELVRNKDNTDRPKEFKDYFIHGVGSGAIGTIGAFVGLSLFNYLSSSTTKIKKV